MCVFSWNVHFCSHNNLFCVYFIFHLLVTWPYYGLTAFSPSSLSHFLPGPRSFRWPIPAAPAESSGSSNTGSSGEGVAGRFSYRWELLVNLADLKPGPEVSFATAGKDICIANPQTVWKPQYKQCEAATSISSSSFVLLYRRVSVCVCKGIHQSFKHLWRVCLCAGSFLFEYQCHAGVTVREKLKC